MNPVMEWFRGMAARETRADLITKQERAERKLLESETRYAELFENACDLVYTLDFQHHLTSVNRAVEQIAGYTQDEVIGRSLIDFLVPESRERSQQMRDTKTAGTKWY